MQKISGILPASPRTRSVEISDSQPARPGALALGRPMGKNSLGDRVTLSKEFEALRNEGKLPTPEPVNDYKNMGEAKKAKVIADLQEKFFKAPVESPSLFLVEPSLKPPVKPTLPMVTAPETKVATL